MSRGTRFVTLAITALLALPTAPASADPGVSVPDDAVVTLRGDGSGHGIGMSQYGAYGAAREGLSAGRILDFYYPGTSVGRAGGSVKIWIRADDDRDLVVEARDGLTVAEVGGRTWRPREPRATQWRARPNRAGDNAVSFRAGGRWRTWKVVGGDVELAAGGRPLTLRTPDGRARYRGALRSVDFQGTQRLTVNVLPLEHYLRGVVPAEMQAGWPQQALRAQAVAARTFAVHERGGGTTYYDTCDTAACQSYGGVAAKAAASTRAVDGTAGEILTHEGETAFATYSASNGGHTVADPRHPYLVAQEDHYEGRSPDYYDWRRRVTSRQLERATGLRDVARLQVVARDGMGRRGGRVLSVTATARSGAERSLTGATFQGLIGLPSTLFEITRAD